MAKKGQYRIRNWSHYNRALVKRGSITLWFDKKSIKSWYDFAETGKRGRPCTYSNAAIQCLLLIKAVFSLDFRKLEGFSKSFANVLNLPIEVPSYTQICRRQKGLLVDLSHIKSDEPIHAVFDSTGLKIYGEGEWKVRQHGYSKRRTWRKLHLGVDEKTGEIIAMELTTNDISDGEVLPSLLEQIDESMSDVSADGAYDQRKCYEAIAGIEAQANIPPRKDAKIWQHGHCKGPPLARDENLRAIRQHGRKAWKNLVGYHRRSLAETMMFRFKTLFGDKLSNRLFDHQLTEAIIKCKALNKMTQLGMPESYLVTS